MTCDLDTIFGKLGKSIVATEREEFVFTPDAVPTTPSEIKTDRLVIKRGHHDYDGYTIARVDALHFNAQKETYRVLGLCLLSALFHSANERIKIHLSHPKSDIKTLIFDHKTITAPVPGFEYATKLDRFAYSIKPPTRFPLAWWGDDHHRLPGLRLVNEADVIVNQDDWFNRNVVWGCASAEGDMLFVSLLLNISEASVSGNEFVLESDFGGHGVCPGSPEVTLWLPGGIGWNGH